MQTAIFGGEPAIKDLLADPITQILMRRDGVEPDQLRRQLHELGRRLDRRRAAASVERSSIQKD